MRVNVWGEECGGSTARIAARLAARRVKESENMAEDFEAWREQQEIEGPESWRDEAQVQHVALGAVAKRQ